MRNYQDLNVSEEELMEITLSILRHSKTKHDDLFVVLTALKNAASFIQNGLDAETQRMTIQNMNNIFK